MALKIVDQFKVKELHGIFEIVHTAEIQILVDDAGVVTTRRLSGDFTVNDPLTSYHKEYRIYDAGQVITRWCDFVTHKETVVTAINTYPYATVSYNNDVPACGYLTPVAKPADPPNPFGTLIYRPYKYTEFCDHFGNNVRVDILRKYNYEQPQTIVQVDSFVMSSLPPVQVKVFVDRIKHTVSYTGMAQSDVNSNRTYNPGDLITEICDLSTGTNLKVYAQSAFPFANIVEELDAVACQIPSGPDPEYVENWGSPVIMDYKSDGDDKNPRFAPCEVTLNLLSGPNFSLQDLYTEDEREFQVEITRERDGEPETIFKGYLIPDSCQEPFIRAPYEVSIKATDGIGALKSVTYSIPVSSDLTVKQRIIDVIAFALAPTNLNLNIRTVCNVYETVMANGIDDDPLAQAFVSPFRLAGDNGAIMNCYDVLDAICTLFKACLCQENGEWVFKRRSEYAQNKARSRVYNNKALFLYAEQIDAARALGNFDHDDLKIFDPQPDLYRGNAYKRVEVVGLFGQVPSIIFNGGFDLWDGQNFQYWTKYGGINIDRVQKVISGTGYSSFAIEDYALHFKEKAQTGKYVEATPIGVLQGDSLTLKFNVYASNTATGKYTLGMKMVISVGKYYLSNDLNTSDYKWVEGVTHCTILFGSSANVNLSLPEIPATDNLLIKFLGPQDHTETFTWTAKDGVRTGYLTYTENNNYVSTSIDNVSVSKTSSVFDKMPTGSLYISDQSGYYTKRPDKTDILYSDYVEQSVVIAKEVQGKFFVQQVGSQQIFQHNLYAIYTKDGYSKSWYEYGSSSGRVPIGLLLAKSILKDYQKPYWYASGNYLGENLSYSNSLRFDLDCEPEFGLKVFTLLSCSIDVKACTMTNVNMAELFDRFVKSTDITTPYNPGDISPPFINNPNSPPQVPLNGIFTDEFTSEFF